jgi:hypothetical protein
VTGGGAGGTINIVATTYTCTSPGTLMVGGGSAINTGGGGGGGSVLVAASSDTCVVAPLSDLNATQVVPGGLGGGGTAVVEDGETGILALDRFLFCADPVAPSSFVSDRGTPRAVTASDALFILKAAVGSACCDLCVCDANGSDDLTATDALLVLQWAVGQPVILSCPACE